MNRRPTERFVWCQQSWRYGNGGPRSSIFSLTVDDPKQGKYLSWTSIDRVPRQCISLLIVRGSRCPRKGAEEMAIVHAPDLGGLPMNLAGQFNQRSGIGRYADELQRQLVGRVRYISCDVTAGPLKGVPLLRQLPLMVRGLDRRAPLHFPKVLGAGALWFQRLPPSVVTVHDLGLLVWPRERQMFNPIDRALLHLSFSALRYADRLIANSIYTKNTILRCLGIPSERVALVPMGVEHRVFWPRDGAAHQLDDRLGIGGWDDWITILNVGTELPRKNVDMLLRIVAGYRQRGRRVRLV